jgi:hypothetical protein
MVLLDLTLLHHFYQTRNLHVLGLRGNQARHNCKSDARARAVPDFCLPARPAPSLSVLNKTRNGVYRQTAALLAEQRGIVLQGLVRAHQAHALGAALHRARRLSGLTSPHGLLQLARLRCSSSLPTPPDVRLLNLTCCRARVQRCTAHWWPAELLPAERGWLQHWVIGYRHLLDPGGNDVALHLARHGACVSLITTYPLRRLEPRLVLRIQMQDTR